MDVLLESNTKTVEEFYRMREKNRETLEDVLERLGLTKQCEARGIAIGEARAAAERERMRRENERLKALV
jgi:DNA-directed RNA polymerase subunit N (RpoN/RPB10)